MPTINTGGGVRDLGLFHVCMRCPWGPWRLYCMKLDEPVCWNLEKKYVFQCSCFIKQNVNFRWTLPQPTLRSVSSLTLIFIHWAHWLSKWRFRSFYTQIQSAVSFFLAQTGESPKLSSGLPWNLCRHSWSPEDETSWIKISTTTGDILTTILRKIGAKVPLWMDHLW